MVYHHRSQLQQFLHTRQTAIQCGWIPYICEKGPNEDQILDDPTEIKKQIREHAICPSTFDR